ncbi:hypothetical protein ES703_120954 [subsurface metagenome]
MFLGILGDCRCRRRGNSLAEVPLDIFRLIYLSTTESADSLFIRTAFNAGRHFLKVTGGALGKLAFLCYGRHLGYIRSRAGDFLYNGNVRLSLRYPLGDICFHLLLGRGSLLFLVGLLLFVPAPGVRAEMLCLSLSFEGAKHLLALQAAGRSGIE